jgi:hypothetical protein
MKKKSKAIVVLLLFLWLAQSGLTARADTREAILKRTALNNAHREMFATGDFARLDKGMNKIQQEYEKGQWTDVELRVLFDDPFKATNTAFENLYNEWVETYPKSYAARQARGQYYLNRAFAYLGHAGDAEEMKRLVQLSAKDSIAAMALAAKPVMTYCDLIVTYALAGAPDQSRKMLDEVRKIAPGNTMGRYWYMRMLNDGRVSNSASSLGDMRNLAADARKSGMKPEYADDIVGLFHVRLLREGRYEELEKELSRVQQDYEDGKIDDATLSGYFPLYDHGDPLLEEKYKDWLKMYPRSYAAHVLRSLHFLANAGQARGEKYIRETSAQEIQGMKLYTKYALEDAKVAMELAAKPILAYRNIIRISQLTGCGNICGQILDLANKLDPKNSIVRSSYMDTLQTRWGGSLEKMEKLLEEARAAGVSGDKLLDFEDAILVEKIWIGKQAGKAHGNIGRLVTGF